MTLIGSILKNTIELQQKLPKRKENPFRQQLKLLRKLLKKAEFTSFGEHYNFSQLLHSKNIISDYKKTVPVCDYNSIFKKWWYRALNGEPFVCWPGNVKYFALSSGTSEAASKHIPVTKEMLKSIQKTSIRQILSLANYNIPKELFNRGILMIGGSTHLNYNGTYFEGDLSGITASNLPFWFQHFYKPGQRISKERDWNSKLDEITRNAKNWDIGIVCGVPAWIQVLFERIIDHYKVKTIHDIWPNLSMYVHGGVSFSPYKKGFEKLLERPLIYIETYLASEGFIAYQEKPDSPGMKMVMDNGIFYEFVPFDETNFDSDGTMINNPVTLTINQVKENVEYALLISTYAGAWRYLLGDTIKFTSLDQPEMVITGRTKQFLSLCGEHLSQDNMNKAINMLAEQLDIKIKEFTVTGVNYQNLFAHRWYIGTDDEVDANRIKTQLDENLKTLNDDYRVERIAALKEVFVETLPTNVFYDFMRMKGREGGQNKFPRVLKKTHLADWEKFLSENDHMKK